MYLLPSLWAQFAQTQAQFTSITKQNHFNIQVVNKKDEYLITADVVGLTDEQIKVEIEGEQLTLTIGSKQINQPDEAQLLWSEFASGEVEKCFNLPSDANKDEIKAELNQGFLSIIIKKTIPQKKQIEIQGLLVS